MFAHSCRPGRGPGQYLCPLLGGRYIENGSDVSYKTFMDCFGKAKLDGVPWLGVSPLLGGSAYPDASVSMRPELGLLCDGRALWCRFCCILGGNSQVVPPWQPRANVANSGSALEALLTEHRLCLREVQLGQAGGGQLRVRE